jgi:hypothetical protein
VTVADISEKQRLVCREHGFDYVPASLDSKLGFAVETAGAVPLNGMRHPPQGDTNGWYIWCGEELSQAPAFFSPLHTRHLQDRCPEALLYLGLPPGARFLVADGHVDVWYDGSLLSV